MHELTIVIVAYNAEQTIARAIGSAVAAGSYPILLVDDGSVDATIEVAKRAGGDQIEVVAQGQNAGVGAARNRAVAETKTPYGMWLDADDEIMPHRPGVMLEALKAGADIVYDGGLLIDEKTGENIAELMIPDFMFEEGAEVRCFERNWYPLLHCGFRVSFAQKIGFDDRYQCAEDYDFLLRSIMANAKILPLRDSGYRYYHRAGTISRNLDKTRGFVRQSLCKYGLEAFEGMLSKSALSVVEQYGVLAGMAMYRHEFAAAHTYAQKMTETDGDIVPYCMPAGQFSNFISASALAAMFEWQEAHDLLVRNIESNPSADTWNNLGVTLFYLGNVSEAEHAFQQALQLMPGYYDAQKNMQVKPPVNWTTHPLRRQASRKDYGT